MKDQALRASVKRLGGITAVQEIKKLREEGATLAAIGKRFKVTTSVVKGILNIQIK